MPGRQQTADEKAPTVTPELVELGRLDPTIKLDIRYATNNNFWARHSTRGASVHAAAGGRGGGAVHELGQLGYGLLIHDAYRPWYVTKMFWDATPGTSTTSSPIPRRARGTTAAAPSISRCTT